jgi:flavin reductase (DIM6/NTAB) family NADH-FMN oxidoreductase RutF
VSPDRPALAVVPDPPGPVDEREFRELAGRFPTGVVVVTAADGGEVCAMTANSFTSVCLRPPTVLVCLTADSRTAHAVRSSGRYLVNVLREDQRPISEEFARRGAERAGGDSLVEGTWGIPRVPGAIATFACRVVASHRIGDHDVVHGEVEQIGARDGRPLVFWRGRYDELAGHLKDADWCWYS